MSAYYSYIYMLAVTVLSLVILKKYLTFDDETWFNRRQSFWLLSIIAILFIAFIGLRDPFAKEFGDSQSYTFFYNKNLGKAIAWDWNSRNFLYDNLFHMFSSFGLPVTYFYVFCAAIYFGGIAYSVAKIFNQDAITAFIVYLAAFSTYSFSINGIKAGAAASLFLVALAFKIKNNLIYAIPFLILSVGFHHSMRFPVLAFFICCFLKNPKFYTAFWILCFIFAALKITYFQQLFSTLDDDKVAGYLGSYSNKGVLGGFRIDFILYSIMPILVGWNAVYYKQIVSERFMFLFNLYTFINAVWMLCIYAPFTNRIAYLSWLMYPIILIYPLLKEDWGFEQYRTFFYIALTHLSFTLFMFFVYYA